VKFASIWISCWRDHPPPSLTSIGARETSRLALPFRYRDFCPRFWPGTALFDMGTRGEVACGREAARVRRRNQIAGTLEAIDEEAAAHGLTRSAFIASAALEKIRRGT